jgi:hypothetical protein
MRRSNQWKSVKRVQGWIGRKYRIIEILNLTTVKQRNEIILQGYKMNRH